MTIGANEDATDDGTPAEVIILTMDDVSSSDPGNVVNEGAGVVNIVVGRGIVVLVTTGADMDNSALETGVVLDATMDSWELDSVNNVNNRAEVEDGFVEASEGMSLLLELVCITDDVKAELDNGSPLIRLENVDSWAVVISVVNATTETVCRKVVCESELLDSAELRRTVADERDERTVDAMFVEEEEKTEEEEEEDVGVVEGEVEGLFNPAELCTIGAIRDAEKSEDKTVVDGNTSRDVALNVALIDSINVEVVREKIAEFGDELATESLEEAIEPITEIVEEPVEMSWFEIAIDCSVEVVEDIIVIEEGVRIVKSKVVDETVIVEDDVGMALVETATPKEVARTVDKVEATEDSVGTALEERLSALMTSAAFARTLASCPFQQC